MKWNGYVDLENLHSKVWFSPDLEHKLLEYVKKKYATISTAMQDNIITILILLLLFHSNRENDVIICV